MPLTSGQVIFKGKGFCVHFYIQSWEQLTSRVEPRLTCPRTEQVPLSVSQPSCVGLLIPHHKFTYQLKFISHFTIESCNIKNEQVRKGE